MVNRIMEYFNRRGMTWPSYQNALMFLIQEAIEALDDRSEMGDVYMMYSIAEYNSNRNPQAMMLEKFVKKTGNPVWTGMYRPNSIDYTELDDRTLEIMKAIGHLVDCMTRGKWVRNNEKDRDFTKAAKNLIEILTKRIEEVEHERIRE